MCISYAQALIADGTVGVLPSPLPLEGIFRIQTWPNHTHFSVQSLFVVFFSSFFFISVQIYLFSFVWDHGNLSHVHLLDECRISAAAAAAAAAEMAATMQIGHAEY